MITRVTHSLLSAFDYAFKTKSGWDSFLNTLQRIPKERTPAMQSGLTFEHMIRETIHGNPPDESHQWAPAVKEVADILRGSAEQVYAQREIKVAGDEYLLVGVADNIKAGIIFDTKFSKRYEFGRYLTSSQHPAYFRLWPDARWFVYLVCNGQDLYTETYSPDDTEPIEHLIGNFRRYLRNNDLNDLYEKHWRID